MDTNKAIYYKYLNILILNVKTGLVTRYLLYQHSKQWLYQKFYPLKIYLYSR